jgi:hypothetical protein
MIYTQWRNLGGVEGVVVQGGNVKHRPLMRETLYKFEIKWGDIGEIDCRNDRDSRSGIIVVPQSPHLFR